MKHLCTAAAMVMLLATAPSAQTYDELLESGDFGSLSTMEQNVLTVLAGAGVPEDCLGKLTFQDVAVISGVANSSNKPNGGKSIDRKKRRIKAYLEAACSD